MPLCACRLLAKGHAVAKAAGRDIAVIIGAVAVIGLIIWRVRRARRDRRRTNPGTATRAGRNDRAGVFS
jgi:hypothetical protein